MIYLAGAICWCIGCLVGWWAGYTIGQADAECGWSNLWPWGNPKPWSK